MDAKQPAGNSDVPTLENGASSTQSALRTP